MKSMPKKAQTELLHAAEHGDYLLLCQLLSKYSVADVLDYYGNTPLMLAARNGKTRTVKTLIEAGAYIHATNRDRENALILASREAHPRIVRVLLECGALFEQSIGNRRALVMLKTDENLNHIIDIISAPYGHDWKPWGVMEKPTNLRIKRINRLMCNVIELLLVAGADVDIHDDENNTPLHIFIRCGDLNDCVRILLKHNPYPKCCQ